MPAYHHDHPAADCSPERCGSLPLVAPASPPGRCESDACQPGPALAMAVRVHGPADPRRLCAQHQWTEALALAGGHAAALDLIAAADTIIDLPSADGAMSGAELAAAWSIEFAARERRPAAAPMLLLAAMPDGRVLAAWQMDAWSPGRLVTQVSEITGSRQISREAAGLQTLDPARWYVVGTGSDNDPGPADVAGLSARYHLDLALRALAAKDAELAAARADADRLAIAAAATAVRGAAAELNVIVREDDGTWMDGSDVIEKLGGWLTEHGEDARNPIDRPGCEPACTYPVGEHTEDCTADEAVTAAWLAAPPGVIGSVAPHPPDLPLSERHRWVCAWALTVQAKRTAGVEGLTFHGTPAGAAMNVALETAAGEFICELANTGYRKSPTGMAAGYLGSGAAALARSMLTAALGPAAACKGCGGTGRITWLPELGWVPFEPFHDNLAVTGGAGVDDCHLCDGDGIGVRPALYQRFKEQVISPLDGHAEWHLGAAWVLSWLAENAGTELAAAAVTRISGGPAGADVLPEFLAELDRWNR
jgi:hypothetical protein